MTHNPLAFPGFNYVSSNVHDGMTLLDYFAAHAPFEPPNWFQPVMPDAPKIPEVSQIINPALRRDVQTAIECDTDPETEEGRRWMDAFYSARTALREWMATKSRERDLQWPLYWANEMLKRRCA